MQIFLNVLKGLIIGGSMAVPGVSGGTMAILLGCYDDMIRAVSSFLKNIRKNALFLLQLCGGAVLGLVLISSVISKALENEFAKEPLLCLFVGVVLGGVPIMYRKTKSAVSRKRDYLYCLGGFLLVLPLSFIPEKNILNLAAQTGPQTIVFLLIAGFIVAIALVLPGISASLMLTVMGLYKLVFDAGRSVNLPILIPFALGLLIGTFSTARLFENLMNRYPRKTYLAIIGFVLGSAHQVLPSQFPKGWEIPLCVLAIPAGFFAVTLMGKAGGKEEASKEN